MPLYDYKCQKCGHRFEKIQQFSDAPIKKCPECGGKVEKLISAPSVRFKGSGFYVTDYAKSGSSGGGGKSSDSEASSSGSATKTESQGSGSDGKESKAKPKSETSEKRSSKK